MFICSIFSSNQSRSSVYRRPPVFASCRDRFQREPNRIEVIFTERRSSKSVRPLRDNANPPPRSPNCALFSRSSVACREFQLWALSGYSACIVTRRRCTRCRTSPVQFLHLLSVVGVAQHYDFFADTC